MKKENFSKQEQSKQPKLSSEAKQRIEEIDVALEQILAEQMRLKQIYNSRKLGVSDNPLSLEEITKMNQDMLSLNEQKSKLKQEKDVLSEKNVFIRHLAETEAKPLREQYETQKDIYIKVGLLEKLSSGEWGIKAISGQQYVFPTYQEVVAKMNAKTEIMEQKMKQGFVRLQITPFGMKLDDLIAKYKQVILKHHQEGKLFATKKQASDPDEPLKLDENEPVWTWDKYNNADVDETLVYDPKKFTTDNHQGKTKTEILAQRGGFNIILGEDLPNIPRENQGKTIGGRPQIETNQSPDDYLDTLKTNSVYQHESGTTPEEQIIYAILHLEQTNQVIDDFSGNGSTCIQLAGFSPFSGGVPYAYWHRKHFQVNLNRDNSGDCAHDDGARFVVRV